MKVALVTSGHENLGVEFISSYIKNRGHEVQLFFDPQTFGGGIFLKISLLQRFFDLQNNVVKEVVEWYPDIVGFSCMTHNYQWSLQVAYKIKERIKDVPIIFGGIHPTSLPEEVLSHNCVDMVAVGEGEASFAELLDNFKNNKKLTTNVKGIYFKDHGKIIPNLNYPLIQELDSLPFPDKKLFYDKIPGLKDRYYMALASRGCPFTCSYCCNSLFNKLYKGQGFQRRRSVNNVISELVLAKNDFNISQICFEDEVFTGNMKWLVEFSKKYKKEVNLPFIINSHFDLLKEKHVEMLKYAGCCQIKFGLQSASEKVRREVCNRYYTNEQVMEVVRICQKYEIPVSIDHIFGLPYETEDDLKQAVELYRDMSPNIVYSYWLTYYPETEIVQLAKEAGLLSEEDVEKISTGEGSFYHKGTFIKNKGVFLKYELLFDLIPFLPRKLHKKLENSTFLLKLLPKGYFVHFFIVSLHALKSLENLSHFFGIIKFVFSQKNVP